MKLKGFLTLHGLNLMFLGVSMLLMPVFLWDVYGVSLDINGVWLARFAACLIIGNALFSVLIRNATWQVIRPFLLVQLFDWGAVMIVFILMQIKGITNGMNWSNIGIAIFWLVVFSYFSFAKSEMAAKAA
ncbi:MAG: hypothetical protein GY943_35805 [Chloroflexi bacterium]|nr:hypothetical protein [Chloroflexota bacterium]